MRKVAAQPRQASGIDLKEALRLHLDEVITALDESIEGLTDAQFWAFPVENRHNIVTLVEHCIQCLDLYACEVHGQALTFPAESRFDIWRFSAETLRPLMADLPTVAQEKERIALVRAAIERQIESVTEQELRQPGNTWWFEENPERTRADALARCACHTAAHVRQIWFLRGRLGLTDDQGWPEQIWA